MGCNESFPIWTIENNPFQPMAKTVPLRETKPLFKCSQLIFCVRSSHARKYRVRLRRRAWSRPLRRFLGQAPKTNRLLGQSRFSLGRIVCFGSPV